MARWTRYARRRMRGLRRRLGYSVRYRRRLKRSYRWRGRRRGYSRNRTKVVKLTTQQVVNFHITEGTPAVVYAVPFSFSPSNFPGFTDYFSTNNEFRLLKCTMKVHVGANSSTTGGLADNPYTYLRVSSRPFTTQGALVPSANGLQNLPLNTISRISDVKTLRQSRWQKQVYPSDTRNVLKYSFYPYTLRWTGRPVNSYSALSPEQASISYLEYSSGRRWMPFSFLGPDPTQTALADDVVFYGPYLVRLQAGQADTQGLAAFSAACEITLYAQFRGQR